MNTSKPIYRLLSPHIFQVRLQILGDHLQQRWTICGSQNWSREPPTTNIAVDCLGNHLHKGPTAV